MKEFILSSLIICQWRTFLNFLSLWFSDVDIIQLFKSLYQILLLIYLSIFNLRRPWQVTLALILIVFLSPVWSLILVSFYCGPVLWNSLLSEVVTVPTFEDSYFNFNLLLTYFLYFLFCYEPVDYVTKYKMNRHTIYAVIDSHFNLVVWRFWLPLPNLM